MLETVSSTPSASGGPSDLPEPPRVRGLPFLGSSLPLLRNPLRFLREQHKQRGDVFSVSAATRRFVVIGGQAANRFAATTGRDALSAESFWGALGENRGCPHLLTAMEGEDHRTLRKLFSDDLSRQTVQGHSLRVAGLTRDAFEEVGEGQEFCVRDLSRLLVSRQVHHMVTHAEQPVERSISEAMLEVFRWQTNTLLLGKWPKLALRMPRYAEVLRTTERFVDAVLTKVEADGAEATEGWFGSVLRGREAYPELFTEGDVRMNFLLPFVAGVDTVGSTLAFLLYEVMRTPALHARVTAAVDACFETHAGAPSVEDLRAVDELRGLMLETMRLYPAAFGVYRQATRDFEFEGHRIHKGEELLVFTTSTHTDERLFPEPYVFDIDRYKAPRDEHRQKFAFAPYGAGPHICLGAGMGEAQLLLTAATILRDVQLHMPNPEQEHGPVFDPSLGISGTFRLRYDGRR